VYLKIRAPIDRIMKEADRINMKLPLQSDQLRTLLKSGRKDENNNVSKICHIFTI
jgi:hypothetical protein